MEGDCQGFSVINVMKETNFKCIKCKKGKIEVLPKKSGRVCILCRSVRRRLYHIANKERNLVLARKYKEKHAKSVRQKNHEYYNQSGVKERVKIYHCRWRKNNKKRLNENRRKYLKIPQNKIAHNLRIRIGKIIDQKIISSVELLGCTRKFLVSYLESLFKPGMTWKNYGPNGWHIDHIKPCASFDLIKPEEQRKCCHYTNLQPLWAIDNIKKSDRC